jgi:hypothetical protein
MKTLKALLLTAAVCGGAIAATPAQADNFSFTGNFSQDDNVQLFNFVVGAPSNVTLRTWSYAGGVNAAGATIARGGFDPILALFDATGALLGQNDDGGCGLVAADITGRCWDTFFTASLGAGNYTVGVMQYDNFANGPNLSNGFSRSGQGNFTPGMSGCAASQNSFEDVSTTAACGRDNHWAFDILNVAEAVQTGGVPEPATWAMLLLGFAMVGGALRSRRQVARVRFAF